ncbi:MAG TPA: carbon monoxide dehydrogenase subunit G [Streptosporangiaceae bacterium]|nr:carbon monoxide dehydrogenase subunit G [Streptosporangiaceae bacterium]
MKVAGEVTLKAPCDVVWSVLHDPAVLRQAIPGCEWLEVAGPGVARLSVRMAIAAVSGSYAGQLAVTDRQRAERIAFKASASGDQGTAAADVTVRLLPEGDDATMVSYQADGVVSGPVAGVGTRLLATIAKRIADDFLAAVEQQVADRTGVTAGAQATAGPDPAGQGPAKTAAGRVTTGRPAESPESADQTAQPLAQGGQAPAGVAGARRRPRLAVAFGVGVALGLGAVIVSAVLGRKGSSRAGASLGS